MHRTPEGEPDVVSRPYPSRWSRMRAACLARLRVGAVPPPVNRLLFLDDDPVRAAVFLREHPDAVWVTNVPDCVARLAEPWHEVHLDHDLGGKLYVDSQDQDCGMEVIRWLCKEPRPHLNESRFYVHTHNATAGLLMVLLMLRRGYKAEFRPFGLNLEKLLAHNNEAGAAVETVSEQAAPWTGRLARLVSAWRGWLARLRGSSRVPDRK